MKKTIGKMIIAAIFLMGWSACSVGNLCPKQTGVEPGSCRHDYGRGQPNFGTTGLPPVQSGMEDWEYRKWLSGSDAVVIVSFEDGRVISMDSFERPQAVSPTILAGGARFSPQGAGSASFPSASVSTDK